MANLRGVSSESDRSTTSRNEFDGARDSSRVEETVFRDRRKEDRGIEDRGVVDGGPVTIIASEPIAREVTQEITRTTTKPWSPLARVAFRIAFLYFFCFMFFFGNGTIFQLFLTVGEKIESVLTWPFNHLAVWTGQHVFHLTGLAADWQGTGSGDTALNWILNGLFVVFALAGGLTWTVFAALLGNRRKEYQTLYAWLRFGLRLTCGYFMLNYGLAKVFPLQMAPISIAILNEPVGQMSPMTFLWALIGLNPIYEMICGFAEVLGGLLLLFRRTALAGALLSSFVMTNVVLYNFFFDVPVKIFALNLLLACLFLIVPDLGALFSFFWLHRPAAPRGIWIPPMSRRGFRIATIIVEGIFVIGFIVGMPIFFGIGWRQREAKEHSSSILQGAWHLDRNHPASGAFITKEGLPATDFYIDTPGRAFIRATDLALWRTYLDIDEKAHTMDINCAPGNEAKYAWQMPDPNHLTLTTVPPEKTKDGKKAAFEPAVVTLTRVPTPAHYPLLERGFHFVNPWGLER